MNAIWLAEFATFSATIATALLVWPTISSPIIYSAVVVELLVIAVRVTLGADKVLPVSASAASYIPWISIISGVLREIFSSCTLVPYG